MSAMSLSLPGLRHSTSCVMKYSHLQLRLKILSPSFNVFGKLQQLPGFRKYFVLTGNLYKPLVFVIVRCYFLNVVSFLVCIYQGVAGKRTTPPPCIRAWVLFLSFSYSKYTKPYYYSRFCYPDLGSSILI